MKLEMRFDLVVVSERERMRKPEPEIYRGTPERLGLPGEACLYLDDIEANLAPARELGMVTDPGESARQVHRRPGPGRTRRARPIAAPPDSKSRRH